MAKKQLKNNYFIGVILEDEDPQNRGRMRVHIPALQSLLPESEGMFCKNRVHDYRHTTQSEIGSYGSYLPIMPGTLVHVLFTDDDTNSGEIVKVVADQEKDALPFNVSTESRDQIFQVLRTPRYDNVIMISEDTPQSDEPPNTLWVYYNNGQSLLIIDQDGIHWKTDDNEYITVNKDKKETVNKNYQLQVAEDTDVLINKNLRATVDSDGNIHVKGNADIAVDQDAKIAVGGNTDVNSGGDVHVTAGGAADVQAGSTINADGSAIYMQSGKSSPAAEASPDDAESNKGYEETPPGNKEIQDHSGE